MRLTRRLGLGLGLFLGRFLLSGRGGQANTLRLLDSLSGRRGDGGIFGHDGRQELCANVEVIARDGRVR